MDNRIKKKGKKKDRLGIKRKHSIVTFHEKIKLI